MRPDLGGLDAALEILQIRSPLIILLRAWRRLLRNDIVAGKGERLMKPLRIVATIAVLAWPVSGLVSWPTNAHAQMPAMNLLSDQPSKSPEQIEKEQAQEKAYKESLKKIPDAKSADPWGGVRSSDASKSTTSSSKTATPTKQKTKTGSNAN
jgi:hypothetical protein